MKPGLRGVLGPAAFLLLGVVIGGWLFARSQPRSVIAIRHCTDCLTPKDLAGLLGSVGVQRAPGLIPFVALETDKSIAVRTPIWSGRIHYVIIPKRDIKNLGELTPADAEYVMDAIGVAQALIARDHLRRYSFYTNGPGNQSVTYLHFHLEQSAH